MKIRLDEYLVKNEGIKTKAKAREHIVNRQEVYVNNKLSTKAGTMIDCEKDVVDLKIKMPLFVSRAGLKLDKAINIWKINLTNKICLDIGASTGGFTQVCLLNNAKLVYAVDVGSNQLDPNIKNNKKVIDISPINFRYVKKEDFTNAIDFFCCDVSFISLDKILPVIDNIIDENICGVILLKPQFEMKSNNKLLNEKNHCMIIESFLLFAKQNHFEIKGITYSPILGNKKSNIEYLIYLCKNSNPNLNIINYDIKLLVQNAWANLKLSMR